MAKESGPSSIFKKGVARHNKDGSFNVAAIDKSVLADNFGLRVEDVTNEVARPSIGGGDANQKGTVAEMLNDCPHVADPIRDAHKKDGIEGTLNGLKALSFFGVNAEVTEETIKMNREGTLFDAVEQEIAQDQKKNRSRNQTQVFPPMNP